MLDAVRHSLAEVIAATLGALGVEEPKVGLETPPRRELGDIAWAGALPLAKALRRPPRAIAEEVAGRVAAAVQAAPEGSPLRLLAPEVRVEDPGFCNFGLRRGVFLAQLLAAPHGAAAPPAPGKVVVEHTNINPNKAAHIGHLRNAVLGDVLVRCLRRLGHPTEVQNYIDDTGVQVADVAVGFLFLPEEELAAAAARVWHEVEEGHGPLRARVLAAFADRERAGTLVSEQLGEPDFDDLCWDLYPRVTRRYEAEEAFAARRAEVLHAIEGGFPPGLSLAAAVAFLCGPDALASASPTPDRPAGGAIARLAAAVAEANLRCHLITMGRLGVAYDVLPHESDILGRGFWKRAFELLQASGAIRLEHEGKNAGCWVMSLAESPEFAGMEDADKILVRSNGTVTYTGKDIAYQLWKLGLLRDPDGTLHDFGYRLFARFTQDGPAAEVRYGCEGRTLERTSSDPAERPAGASFGGGARVYNVIDVRQSYPQKVVKEAIRVLGHPEAAEASIHFAYEMVALTPKAARRLETTRGLDFGLSEDDMRKPFIEMSGRRGIGVEADALLATLVEEAGKAVAARAGEGVEPARLAERARAIAVGALRYQMARQSRNRVLAFDFDDALEFEGDTGPYLQYSAVRARKIFEKLAERGLAGSVEGDAEAVREAELPDGLWDLVLGCARTREMVAKAVVSLEFSLVASHAHDLAQLFHKLYHDNPVLHAPDEPTRAVRRAVFRLFAAEIADILESLLGIPVPAEM
ncbi:MAG TPA: arginine--tRNA ligase [Thermoanaerobaculaceae bacterium]|nr:arginine--tRNA ligase [Thermoanaerobaculaceae bacterium]HRS16850.1 arginine--tRNA ligase [Thermoanaerobaculaceae bacterium]